MAIARTTLELRISDPGSFSLSLSLNSPTPLPERAPPPFIGVLDLFPQISWREGLPHGDEGGGRVHDKGRVHGRGPWQRAVSPKLKSHRPTRTVGWRR